MLIDIVLIFIQDIHTDEGNPLLCDDLSKSLEEILEGNPVFRFVCDGKKVIAKTKLEKKIHTKVLNVRKRKLCLQRVHSK